MPIFVILFDNEDEDYINFPKINLYEKTSSFWQDISKDIISPFAPSNKTLLLHLLRKNSENPLKNETPFKPQRKIINSGLQKSHVTPKTRSSFREIISNPLQFNEFGQIRRKSCNGNLFGFDTPFQKRTNHLVFQMKKAPLPLVRNSSPASSRSSKKSISLSALVKTKNMFQRHSKKLSSLPRPEDILRPEHNKKSVLLGAYEPSQSICIQSSLLSYTSKKSSIGKFVDFSKNSNYLNKKSGGDIFINTLNEITSPVPGDSINGISQKKLKRSSTICEEEAVKLTKKGIILQKMLQNTLERKKIIDNPEIKNKLLSVDLGKYCKKEKAKSFDGNNNMKIEGKKGKDQKIMGVYSRENVALKVCGRKMRSIEKIDKNIMKTNTKRTLMKLF